MRKLRLAVIGLAALGASVTLSGGVGAMPIGCQDLTRFRTSSSFDGFAIPGDAAGGGQATTLRRPTVITAIMATVPALDTTADGIAAGGAGKSSFRRRRPDIAAYFLFRRSRLGSGHSRFNFGKRRPRNRSFCTRQAKTCSGPAAPKTKGRVGA
jgi:hypothetical protein